MKSPSTKSTHRYKGMNSAERIEERRKKFLVAGAETFGTKGYARTGIRDVCRAAGLTERYFYESFETKEDLLCAVYAMIVDDGRKDMLEIISRTDISPGEKAAMGIRAFYARLLADPGRARVQFFEVLGVSPRVDVEYLSALSQMSGMIQWFTGEFFPGSKDEGPAGWIIPTGLAGAMVQIAMKWILNGFDVDLDELVKRLTDMLFTVGKTLDPLK